MQTKEKQHEGHETKSQSQKLNQHLHIYSQWRRQMCGNWSTFK